MLHDPALSTGTRTPNAELAFGSDSPQARRLREIARRRLDEATRDVAPRPPRVIPGALAWAAVLTIGALLPWALYEGCTGLGRWIGSVLR